MRDIPLKPCPFCGKCAVVVKLGFAHTSFTYRVMCVNCSVRTLAHKDENSCIKDWNRRVSGE